jgi:negative regulator of sigma E activity
MNEEILDPAHSALEERSRAVFNESVEHLDMRTRSRLNRARQAALAAAAMRAGRRSWLTRMPVLTSAGGVAAAAVLGVALWFGGPLGHHNPVPAAESTFEDLDLVASSDEGAGDAMEMMQDDIDFYDWADKAASSEPAA